MRLRLLRRDRDCSFRHERAHGRDRDRDRSFRRGRAHARPPPPAPAQHQSPRSTHAEVRPISHFLPGAQDVLCSLRHQDIFPHTPQQKSVPVQQILRSKRRLLHLMLPALLLVQVHPAYKLKPDFYWF